MIVMKFGGTSLGDSNKIKNVASIINSNLDKKPIIIVSAIAKITDLLLRLTKEKEILKEIENIHNKIVKELELDSSLLEKDFKSLSKISDKNNFNLKEIDEILSFGEVMSSKIISAYLNKINIKAEAFNSYDLGFLTNSNFKNAEPLEITYSNLSKIKSLEITPVITGFIGKTKEGDITTLGRSGSDYTASIIANSIDAEEIQIWSDVDGIMSADPKVVDDAITLREVSFAEASELAYFGARVLHPKTIIPAMNKNIPVRVLNSLNPEDSGTLILNKSNKSDKVIKSIAYKKDITLINIESKRMLGAVGFLAKIFSIFEKYGKSIDVISTSEVSVSLTIDNSKNIEEMINELNIFSKVDVYNNKSIICVVGEGIKDTIGIAGKIFTILGDDNINIEMISQGASKVNITFIVNSKDTDKTVKVLHKYFN